MSTGDNERVNSGVPAASAHSFGPRGSLASPRALALWAKDRIAMLPEAVKRPLADHLEEVKRIHKDVKTTMVYTHVLNRGGRGVRSPADSLGLPRSQG